MTKMTEAEKLIRRILSQPHSCIHCDDKTDRLGSMSIMKWTGQLLYLIANLGDEYMLSQLELGISDKYPIEED